MMTDLIGLRPPDIELPASTAILKGMMIEKVSRVYPDENAWFSVNKGGAWLNGNFLARI